MNTLSVRILDKELKVACPEEQVESLSAAARMLDTRMREIRDASKSATVERVALMAALDLAHDLLQQRGVLTTDKEMQLGVARMRDKIENVLEVNRQLPLDH